MGRTLSFLIGFFALILFHSYCFGQTESQGGQELPSLLPLLKSAKFPQKLWMDEMSAKKMLGNFEKWLADSSRGVSNPSDLLIVKHQERVNKLLGGFRFVSNKVGKVIPADKKRISPSPPIWFAQKENPVDTVLAVTHVLFKGAFNTTNTTPKSRAATAMSEVILPEMPTLYDIFKDTEVKYYAMTVTYGSFSFGTGLVRVGDKSQKVGFGDEAIAMVIFGGNPIEMVALIVSSENCKKFVEGVITDNELLDVSDVYLFDRGDDSFKKTEVKIE